MTVATGASPWKPAYSLIHEPPPGATPRQNQKPPKTGPEFLGNFQGLEGGGERGTPTQGRKIKIYIVKS